MGVSAESTDHFDRFDNADAARDFVDEREEQKQQEREETIELYGKAEELFDARSRDTFEIELHGVEIEFLYPDPETRDEFEQRQTQVIEQAQEGANLLELLQEARVGIESMKETLSEHAVDPSFNDPRVWRDGLGLTDDEVGELYEDFMELGQGDDKAMQLEMLQTLMSDGRSQD